jgi:tetratricopeptide (TPR) repeat protein
LVDLTGLNPNVFYELGVRHSLRGRGTIIIHDTSQREETPFDLEPYRTIRFTRDLQGYRKLKNSLGNFIAGMEEAGAEHRDSPVHHWLPILPENAVQSASGSKEGELQGRLKKVLAKLKQYEEIYGKVTSDSDGPATDPAAILRESLKDASHGNSRVDLIQQAESAVQKRNIEEFLSVVLRIMEKKHLRFSGREFLVLAHSARTLGLSAETGAIYDHATKLHPNDRELRSSQLAYLAHSDDPAVRERARREIHSDIRTVVLPDKVDIPGDFEFNSFYLLGMLLDAYHEDGLHDEALRITLAAVERYPDKASVVRNHARALENCGRREEALLWYQKAIWCPDSDDAAAVWLGSELHNRERHVDALEAYLLACQRDPDDAENFAHVADEVAWALREQVQRILRPTGRPLPQKIDGVVMERVLTAVVSCPMVSHEALKRCSDATRRVDIGIQHLDSRTRGRQAGDGLPGSMTFEERYQLAASLYAEVQSPITTRPKSV